MPANLVFRLKIWGARDNGIPPRSTPENTYIFGIVVTLSHLLQLSNDEGFEDARSEPSRPASPVDEAASICEPDQGQDVDNVWHLVIEATPLKHYVWEATAK